jgi:hypothetical protein
MGCRAIGWMFILSLSKNRPSFTLIGQAWAVCVLVFSYVLVTVEILEPGCLRQYSVYGLDDRAIGVRSPAGAKDFSSSLCVQTGSGAHPASCLMGTGGPFPGGKSAAVA